MADWLKHISGLDVAAFAVVIAGIRNFFAGSSKVKKDLQDLQKELVIIKTKLESIEKMLDKIIKISTG